jgi:uncharacterized membrane protein YbhN (UPF0104 family)
MEITQMYHYPQHANAEPVLIVFATLFVALLVLISLALNLLIWCKLFSKAGYSWALGLLMLLPIVSIIMPFFLAFADWPIRRELRQLKQRQEKPQA